VGYNPLDIYKIFPILHPIYCTYHVTKAIFSTCQNAQISRSVKNIFIQNGRGLAPFTRINPDPFFASVVIWSHHRVQLLQLSFRRVFRHVNLNSYNGDRTYCDCIFVQINVTKYVPVHIVHVHDTSVSSCSCPCMELSAVFRQK